MGFRMHFADILREISGQSIISSPSPPQELWSSDLGLWVQGGMANRHATLVG
jgi:hypothetical protein